MASHSTGAPLRCPGPKSGASSCIRPTKRLLSLRVNTLNALLTPSWLETLRIGTLYLLALSLFLVPVGVGGGLALVWVWMAAAMIVRHPVPTHPAVWLALSFALYCLVQAGIPRLVVDDPGLRWGTAWSWAQIVVFVPVAYALRGDQRLVLRLLLTSLIGLLLGMIWRTDWALLIQSPAAFADSRPGFGFPTLAYALFAGTALLGLVILRRRCWYDSAGRLRWWALLPWTFATLVVAEGVVLSQARGSWLSLVLVTLIGVGVWWLRQRRRGGALPRAKIAAVLAALLLLIGLNSNEIVDRLNEERAVVDQLLEGELLTDEITSLTLRWHALVLGLERWQERPWFGWGPGASRPLMADSNEPGLLYPEPDGSVLKHLHNSYLELMVQLGLIGLGLWLAVAVLLLLGLYRLVQRGELSADLGWFLGLALLYLAFWSHFNFRMVNQDFRGYWSLLAGAALSFSLYRGGGSPSLR